MLKGRIVRLVATILLITFFTTSCTTWVSDPMYDLTLKTGVVGLSAAAIAGLAVGISNAVADSPEKAQKQYEDLIKDLNEADSFNEISDILAKAQKRNKKSEYFNYEEMKNAINRKLTSLNLPYSVSDDSIKFDITALLSECKSVDDIIDLISLIKDYGEGRLELVSEQIAGYMKNNDIPYSIDPETMNLVSSNEIPELLEKYSKKAVMNENPFILTTWISQYEDALASYYGDNLDSTIQTIIKTTIDELIENALTNKNSDSIVNIFSDTRKYALKEHLDMSSDEISEYLLEREAYFKEKICYEKAIKEQNPFIYTEQYPEGQYDASAIPISAEIRDYKDAKSSVVRARNFLKNYPDSQYADEIKDYMVEANLAEWRNSDSYKKLLASIPSIYLDVPIYYYWNTGLRESGSTIKDLLSSPSLLINTRTKIEFIDPTLTISVAYGMTKFSIDLKRVSNSEFVVMEVYISDGIRSENASVLYGDLQTYFDIIDTYSTLTSNKIIESPGYFLHFAETEI